jgi:hypothetical protein
MNFKNSFEKEVKKVLKQETVNVSQGRRRMWPHMCFSFSSSFYPSSSSYFTNLKRARERLWKRRSVKVNFLFYFFCPECVAFDALKPLCKFISHCTYYT